MAIESKVVRLQFAALFAHRSVAIDLVGCLVAHVTSDGTFRDAVTTAFGEAFNNVVEHSYRDRSDGLLDVEAEISETRVKLTLTDSGLPADLTEVALPDLATLPEGGMGLYMMHSFVDEVVYRAGSPNVLTLTKWTAR